QATDQMERDPNAVSPTRCNRLTGSPRFRSVSPNRVFVGGIDFKTNENDLKEFFGQYGSVTEVKIIRDRAGVRKGYGFVAFETQEEAQKILQDARKLKYKDKKLCVAPARKKQPQSPNALPSEACTMYLTTSSGYPYVYRNGVAYFHTPEVSSVQQPWPSCSVSGPPVMVAPPVYLPPTYHYQAPTQCLSSQSQWQWSILQSSASSLPLLYLRPSEVIHQPIGINQEGECVSPPLLMEAPVPELYSDHGVQTLHPQPYVQSHIAMPGAV
ncbi:BOLL protein, partial [Sitta europaea]|nr:BOLL protein [Sitta europaea]